MLRRSVGKSSFVDMDIRVVPSLEQALKHFVEADGDTRRPSRSFRSGQRKIGVALLIRLERAFQQQPQSAYLVRSFGLGALIVVVAGSGPVQGLNRSIQQIAHRLIAFILK